MHLNDQVRLIATIPGGHFTEGRLRQMGFDMEAVRRASRIGLFESNSHGVLTLVKHRLRPGKLRQLGERVPVAAGQTVQRVEDGKLVTYQVVVAENGKVTLVNPQNPNQSIVVGEEEVSPVAANPADPNSPPANPNDPKAAAAAQDAPPAAPAKTPYV